MQSKSVVVNPYQSATIPAQVSAAQTGINISSILGLMLPVMVIGMMGKMMGSVTSTSTKPIEIEIHR
jgi:hypothetical protein